MASAIFVASPHGVDGDQCAGQLQAFQEQGYRTDFVGFRIRGLLPQHQPLARGPGRDDVQRVPLAAPRPARGLAIDGDDVGFVLAQTLDPGREGLREQRAVERVQHVVERVMRRNALREGQHPPQKPQLLAPPVADLDEILRPRQRRTQDQEHDLGQRIHHLAPLARIGKRRKVVEKRRAGHAETSIREVSHESRKPNLGNPYAVQAIAPPLTRVD